MTSSTDKGGHTTKYVYDAAGNVIQTIDAKGNVAAFEYDLMGNLTKVTLHRVDTQDGVDEYEVTLYEYDGRGLVTKVVDALGNVTTTEYDGNGNIAKVTDADGFVTEYTYNALDMVTHINYNGGKEVSYQYNAVGDLVQMDDWTGTNTFEVDLLNRITAVTDHKGNKVTYEYDATGNQTKVGYPDGTSVTKAYDLVGNLESVVESDGRTTTYQYDGMGRVVHMNYPDGWQEDYTYDAMGQVLSILDTDPSGKDMKQQKNKFEYDACGNMTYEYMRGNGTGEATTEVFYTYDELHQVVTAKENYGNKSRSYQYDSLGNLTLESNSNNVTVDYKLNNLNQITTSSDDGWKTSTAYSYDKRGNLIQELYTKGKKQSVTGAYTFDETNKMVKGVNDLGESSEYLYNGLGALVTNTWTIKKNAYGYHDVTALVGTAMVDGEIVVDKQAGKKDKKAKKDPELVLADANLNKTSTVVKDFVVDYTVETMDPLYETESTDNGLEYRYVYGLNGIRLSVTVKGVENGAGHIIENGDEIRLYYHQDLRGTVDYLTSPVSGKVESWTHYNEWGEVTHNAVLKCGQRELDLVKNYTGHEYDAVLGMYYAKARFYDAGNRRFISMDPVKGTQTDPISMVQYLYVKNNSLIYIDPTGEVIEEFRVWLSGEGWKTVDELAKEGVRWANWENILSEKIAKELNEKGIGKIEDDALRVLLTDTVIYKNAQELQDEFYTIYIASGPAISTSHIIHTTLEPLYEEYQVPVDPDKEFWNGLFNAFNAGISVGMDFATMEMIADASYVNTNKNPWGKDVFTRGQIVDDALGNNLGRTFPRIDIWNKADDAIYSIKSYDTATSYQKARSWYKQLKCDINTLIDVTKDISYRGTTVAVSASTSKGLIIALPNKALTWSQRLDLLDAFTYAADNGIKLIIKVVK